MSTFTINGLDFLIEPYLGRFQWKCHDGKYDHVGTGGTQIEALQGAMRWVQINIDADKTWDEEQASIDERAHNEYLRCPQRTDRV